MTIGGLFWLVEKLVKENIDLKSDMCDVLRFFPELVDKKTPPSLRED